MREKEIIFSEIERTTPKGRFKDVHHVTVEDWGDSVILRNSSTLTHLETNKETLFKGHFTKIPKRVLKLVINAMMEFESVSENDPDAIALQR